MDPDSIPSAWIGQNVRLELRDVDPQRIGGGSRFDSRTGTLQAVTELGLVIEHATGRQERIRFYPWSAVRSIISL